MRDKERIMHEGQEYVKYAGAVKLFVEADLSETTFRRQIHNDKVRTISPTGKPRSKLYLLKDVKAAIEKRKKGIGENSEQKELEGETDWLKIDDEPYAYVFNAEMYGIANAISPTILRAWREKNPHTTRILYQKGSRKDIWGMISILPMKEEHILNLLQAKKASNEITSEEVQAYEIANIYTGYVAISAIQPDRRAYFGSLIGGIMEFWQEHYPGLQIEKLYSTVHHENENGGINLIRKLYFSPLYEIGEHAWELRLNRYNPSKIVTAYQQNLKKKQQQAN